LLRLIAIGFEIRNRSHTLVRDLVLTTFRAYDRELLIITNRRRSFWTYSGDLRRVTDLAVWVLIGPNTRERAPFIHRRWLRVMYGGEWIRKKNRMDAIFDQETRLRSARNIRLFEWKRSSFVKGSRVGNSIRFVRVTRRYTLF